jgi:hypothetical protein
VIAARVGTDALLAAVEVNQLRKPQQLQAHRLYTSNCCAAYTAALAVYHPGCGAAPHLCSRFASMLGTSGSRISSSLMRHRKRSVTPRMYSLGCCRLLRRFWQIRICREEGAHPRQGRQA